MRNNDAPQIVYVGDPMCSWCWGFAPVLERLVADHDLGVRIILGGLRPGAAAEALTDAMKAFLLHHWEQVADASGQPFDRAALEARPSSWRYDTELPAIAVATMRRLDPDAALPFFFRLQQAFYADGVDITDHDVYAGLTDSFDIDPSAFAAGMADPSARQAAWDDFAEARRLGATGFPTTLLAIDGRYRMLAAGFRPFSEVDQVLHAALDRFAPAAAPGAACSIDGGC